MPPAGVRAQVRECPGSSRPRRDARNIMRLAVASLTSRHPANDDCPACRLLPHVVDCRDDLGAEMKEERAGRASRGRPALLLVDFMNPLDFEGAAAIAQRAVEAAQRTATLKARMRTEGVPVIYANDNFGRWESDFDAVVAHCESRGGPSAQLARILAPLPGDRSILKPRHSAFFGTRLEFLLDVARRPAGADRTCGRFVHHVYRARRIPAPVRALDPRRLRRVREGCVSARCAFLHGAHAEGERGSGG